MKRLPLAFVRCVGCGHVFNTKFQYEEVPYSTKPNLMFNQGSGWNRHIGWVCDLLLGYLPSNPVVVEIGCGSGHLLHALHTKRRAGRYIGFDPSTTTQTNGSIEFRGELFRPEEHLTELQPDLLISRHVLEHLMNPLGFLQAISVASHWAQAKVRLYTEVPCIDRAIEHGRVADFYYEHNSHFTTGSFTSMLHRSGGQLEMMVHNYNHEVISGMVQFGSGDRALEYARAAQSHCQSARTAKQTICQQLSELHESGRTVAIWGGTGKAAAFMNYFDIDADRFPIVVDSDISKCDSHVPGMGQAIRFRDELRQLRVDVIVIPMQWRARDIVDEMERVGIKCHQVLIAHQGQLIDFHQDEHPY